MNHIPTLRDVADLAGVHPSTASRALNEPTESLVTESTRERVRDAARQLGYQPNSLARGLKTRTTYTVGMLLPDLTNPLFPPIVRGIEDVLSQEGYTLILGNTDNEPEKERTVADAMLARRVDGMILATVQRDDPLVPGLVGTGTPLVLVNRTVEPDLVSSVAADDHEGIRLAVDHLVSLGHRRIAHVAGPQHLSTGLARYQAFVDTMRHHGLDPDLVAFSGGFHEEAGQKACAEVLDQDGGVTALVAANDLIALGCYDELALRSIAVGKAVSVVGFNDMPFSDKLSPPLTTIHIPHYLLGVEAARLLLRIIEDPGTPRTLIRLQPELVVRASTAPPPGG